MARATGSRPSDHRRMGTQLDHRSTALVVSEDEGLRATLAEWLEDDGIDVMVCPGPRRPHYSCIGLRGQPCPLIHGADLVLVDLHPESGQLIDSTSRNELVNHYRQLGRRVVAIVDGDTTLDLPATKGLAVVCRLAERGTLVGTVRAVLAQVDKVPA
jgi:hypothetical protein